MSWKEAIGVRLDDAAWKLCKRTSHCVEQQCRFSSHICIQSSQRTTLGRLFFVNCLRMLRIQGQLQPRCCARSPAHGNKGCLCSTSHQSCGVGCLLVPKKEAVSDTRDEGPCASKFPAALDRQNSQDRSTKEHDVHWLRDARIPLLEACLGEASNLPMLVFCVRVQSDTCVGAF